MEYMTAEQLKQMYTDSTEALEVLKQNTMKRIIEHAKRGDHTCPIMGINYKGKYYEYEDEIKEWARKLGYGVRPIGISGGVRQIGDEIYW